MLQDIKQHIDLVDGSIAWAKEFGKESFPYDVFKEYRRKLKRIYAALEENCSAAAYGESQDNIEHHYEFLGDKLIIGKFCAIAEGVKFIMNGANHRMDGITTYPFNIFGCGWEKVTPTIEQLPFKGDTVIGNDVWIGQNVTIMPGVIIGDGAIIAANSTVVKSVEPYSIYGGNPAKFIKKRFSDEKIEFLLKLEWWNWSGEEIFDNLEILTSEAGLEELMNKYSKRDAIN